MTKYKDEDDYRDKFAAALEARGWVTQRHEDAYHNFIPDLSISGNGIDGWVEVKYCKKTPLNLDCIAHYTKGQEMFLRRHGAAGSGHCYLLVGLSDWNLLIRWDALKGIRSCPFDALPSNIGVRGTKTIDEMAYFMNKHISGK